MEPGDATKQQIQLAEIDSNSPAATIADARELLLEYGQFVIAQPGAAQFCFSSLEMEAAGLPGSYLDQSGGAIIAHSGESPAGFVAWRAVPASVAPDAWEMKRLWVRPQARGLGLGRTLTMAVLDRARAAQRTAIYLDTAPASMSNAYRLYQELGFKPCAPYNDNAMEGIAYLMLSL
jgi:ribosomal protein S18 acetylase RimI-like enzyme